MRMYELSSPEFMGGGIFFKEDKYERMMRNPETKQAFLCGYKAGKEAVEEDMYGERNYSSGGQSGNSGVGYNQRDWEYEMRRLEDEYHERRRRGSNGRYR